MNNLIQAHFSEHFANKQLTIFPNFIKARDYEVVYRAKDNPFTLCVLSDR